MLFGVNLIPLPVQHARVFPAGKKFRVRFDIRNQVEYLLVRVRQQN
jgi:hypothetical protein